MQRNVPASTGFGRALVLFFLLLPLAAGPGARRALAFEEAEVRAIVGSPRAPADYPGNGGLWSGIERSVRIDGQGNGQVTEHCIAQVFDPAWGEKRFRPYERSYWSRDARPRLLLARVWHSLQDREDVPPAAVTDSLAPEARGVASCAYDRRLRIHFPALKAGDIVELSIFWDLPANEDLLGVNSFAVAYGAEDPVAEQRTTVVHPAALDAGWRFFGPRLLRSAATPGGMAQNTFTGGNLPGGRPLLETPWSRVPMDEDTLDSSHSLILFTTLGSWSQLTTAIVPLWEEAWRSRDDALDRRAGQAISDYPNPAERTRALEQAAQQEIRTVPVAAAQLTLLPVRAREVERDHAGTPRDKACYLTALMRAAGLPAVPVLVHNRRGGFDPEFPCPAQFDRFAVLVRLPEQDLWCDPLGDGSLTAPGFALALPPEEAGRSDPTLAGLIPFPGIPLSQSRRAF